MRNMSPGVASVAMTSQRFMPTMTPQHNTPTTMLHGQLRPATRKLKAQDLVEGLAGLNGELSSKPAPTPHGRVITYNSFVT
jgi:hypothetical protein